jgi:competence protein ComEC
VTAALVLAGLGLWRAGRAATRLTVLPQRGGQAVVLEPAGGGGIWLLDTGDARGAPALTGPFLAARGVNRPAGLALSHGDVRHVGGVPWLLGRFRPRLAVLPAAGFRAAAWTEARAALAAAGVPATNVAAGDRVAGWRVLHPAADDPAPRADDASLVLAAEVDGLRLTVVGDLSRAGQERWLNRGGVPPTDVLVTGLGGDGRALSAAVLERLRPRLVLVADAAAPATARAGPEARAALAAPGRTVVFLGDHGAVQAAWRAGRLTLRDAAGRGLAGPE